MADPFFEAIEKEADARKDLLLKASVQDHDFAVQGVVAQYRIFLQQSTVRARNLLPPEAPRKFAASRYYALLQESVGPGALKQAGADQVKESTRIRKQV